MFEMPGKSSKKRQKSSESLTKMFYQEMEKNNDVQSLNDNVLIPFITALEQTAEARNYVLNIYGKKSNLAFTNEQDAEAIFDLIERYLDKKESLSGS